MATLNLDNYLPSIFRKRPVPLSGDIPIDDPSNVLAPMRGDAPASVNTTDAGTNLAAPVDLGTADTGTTRPRRVETDDKGRPIANTTMTGDAQAIDLNQRVHAYHPQASQGWWDKWGKEMVTGAVKGLRYGPGGALGGAIAGGVRGATNPELADEQWKDEQIASSDADVKRIATGQQLKTKMAQEAAATDLVKARTDALKHPVPKPGHPILTDQGWALLDPVSGVMKPVVDPKTGQQAKGKPSNAKEEWVHDPQGIAHKYENGKDTGQLDSGRNLKVVPGYGLVQPGQAMNADALAVQREEARTEKAGQANLTNAQLDANIKSAQDEQGRLGAAPPMTVDKVDALGNTVKERNPFYEDWSHRYNELEDQKRRWAAEKKAAPTLKSNVSPTPSTHQLVKSEWLKSHPESDWPKAVRTAKTAGYTIVE